MATEMSEDQRGHIFCTFLSVIPIVLSVYFVFETVWFHRSDPPDCSHLHWDWDLAYGLFLFALFVVGTLSLAWSVIPLQIACMALQIVTLVLIQGVTWNVSLGGNAPLDAKTTETVYRLETYPLWAQKFLLKEEDWRAFQNCMIERKFCDDVDRERLFQGGCCEPPVYCGFQPENQTWVIPESGLESDDANCVKWSNENDKLCYNCSTCKASYVYKLAINWSMRVGDLMLAAFLWLLCFGLTFGISRERSRRRSETVHPTV